MKNIIIKQFNNYDMLYHRDYDICFNFLSSKISHIELIIAAEIQEISIEIHAYSIGIFLISIKYHPREQLIRITLKHVMINIG